LIIACWNASSPETTFTATTFCSFSNYDKLLATQFATMWPGGDKPYFITSDAVMVVNHRLLL
jgi:hypothetical protein